jgi:hypothetical protein
MYVGKDIKPTSGGALTVFERGRKEGSQERTMCWNAGCLGGVHIRRCSNYLWARREEEGRREEISHISRFPGILSAKKTESD